MMNSSQSGRIVGLRSRDGPTISSQHRAIVVTVSSYKDQQHNRTTWSSHELSGTVG
jgi:hypothetical protein